MGRVTLKTGSGQVNLTRPISFSFFSPAATPFLSLSLSRFLFLSHRNSMAKNKSSSFVCHHSPPASPPTMAEDFGSLSLGCFSFLYFFLSLGFE